MKVDKRIAAAILAFLIILKRSSGLTFDVGCGDYSMKHPTKMLIVDEPIAVPLFRAFMHAKIETWQNKKLIDSVYIETLGNNNQHLLKFGICNQPTLLVYTLLNGVGATITSRMTIVDPKEECNKVWKGPDCFCETVCAETTTTTKNGDSNNDGLSYPHDPDCMISFYDQATVTKIDTMGQNSCRDFSYSQFDELKKSQFADLRTLSVDDDDTTCYEDYYTDMIDVDLSGIKTYPTSGTQNVQDSHVRVWKLTTEWLLKSPHILKWHLKNVVDQPQEFSYVTYSVYSDDTEEDITIELEAFHYLPVKPIASNVFVTVSDDEYTTTCSSPEIHIDGKTPLDIQPINIVDMERVIVDGNKYIGLWIIQTSIPKYIDPFMYSTTAYYEDGQSDKMILNPLQKQPHPLVPNTIIYTFALYMCCNEIIKNQLPLNKIQTHYLDGETVREVEIDVPKNVRTVYFQAYENVNEVTPEVASDTDVFELITVANTMQILKGAPEVTRVVDDNFLRLVATPKYDKLSDWPYPLEVEIPIERPPPTPKNPNPLGLPEPFIARMTAPLGGIDEVEVTCEGKIRLEFTNPPVMYSNTVWRLYGTDPDFDDETPFINGEIYEVSVGRTNDVLLYATDDNYDVNYSVHMAKISHRDFEYIKDGCHVTAEHVINPTGSVDTSVGDCLAPYDMRTVRIWYVSNIVSKMEIVDATETSYAPKNDGIVLMTPCMRYAEFTNVSTGFYWLEFTLWNGCTINDAKRSSQYKLVNVLKSDPPIKASLDNNNNMEVVNPTNMHPLKNIASGVYEAECGVNDNSNTPVAIVFTHTTFYDGPIVFSQNEMWNLDTGTMHVATNGQNIATAFGRYTIVHTLSSTSPEMGINCKYDAGTVVIQRSAINADIFSVVMTRIPTAYDTLDGIITITYQKELLGGKSVMFMISDCVKLVATSSGGSYQSADCALHVNPFDNTVTNVPYVISATLNILIDGGGCVLTKQFDQMSLGLPIIIEPVGLETYSDINVPVISPRLKFSMPPYRILQETTLLVVVNWKNTNPNHCIGEDDASISFWIVQTTTNPYSVEYYQKASENRNNGKLYLSDVITDKFWTPQTSDTISNFVAVTNDDETELEIRYDFSDHSFFVPSLSPGHYTVRLRNVAQQTPLDYVIYEKPFYVSSLNMIYTDSGTACGVTIAASPFNEIDETTPDLLSVFDRDNYYNQATKSLVGIPFDKQIVVNVPRKLSAYYYQDSRFCNEPIIVECPFLQEEEEEASPEAPPEDITRSSGRRILSVQEPQNPLEVECSVTKNPTSVFLDDGSIQAVATGGTPPYMCIWSDVSYHITTSCNRSSLGIGIYSVTIYDYTFAGQQCEINLLPLTDTSGTFVIESVDVGNSLGCFPNTLLPIDVVAKFKVNQSVVMDNSIQTRMSGGVWLISPEEESPIISCDDPRMHSVSLIDIDARKVQIELIYSITNDNIGILGGVTNFTVAICYMNQYIQMWNSVISVNDLNIPVMPLTLTNIAPQKVCGFDYNQQLVSGALINISFTAPYEAPISVFSLYEAILSFSFSPETSQLNLQLPLPILPLTAIWVMDGHGCAGMTNVAMLVTAVSVCGTCNVGDTSCLGCDGAPFSGYVVDGCGVCNGQSTCLLDCIVSGTSAQKALDETQYCVMNGRAVVGNVAPLIPGAVTIDGTWKGYNGWTSVKYLFFENVTFLSEMLIASSITTDALYIDAGVGTITLSKIEDRVTIIPRFYVIGGDNTELLQTITIEMCVLNNIVLEIAPPRDLSSQVGAIDITMISENIDTLEVLFTHKMSPDTLLWLTMSSIKLMFMEDPYDLLPKVLRVCEPFCDTPEDVPVPDPFDPVPDSTTVHRSDTHFVIGTELGDSVITMLQFPSQTEENYAAFVVGLCEILDAYPFIEAVSADEQYTIKQSNKKTLCGMTATTNPLYLGFMRTTFNATQVFGLLSVQDTPSSNEDPGKYEGYFPQEMTMTLVAIYIFAIVTFLLFVYTKVVKR